MSDPIRNNFLIKAVLTPLSWLYGGITGLRNYGYDKGFFKRYPTPCPAVSVGNLTVGGTGKTPMIEYLVRLLKNRERIAVVSRGYGRKTRGLRVAGIDSSAAGIGDEPLQYYRKFSGEIRVLVAEKRADAAKKIAEEFPDTGVILLDDAFQHRAIERRLDILLTDYNRPFYTDLPFPAGNLREWKKGSRRADIIVVTKSPRNLLPAEKGDITRRIRRYAGGKAPVFFSSVAYGAEIPFAGSRPAGGYPRMTGLSGLARNDVFRQFLFEKYGVEHFSGFPDHYDYTMPDLLKTGIADDKDLALFTTEKDMVKLMPLALQLGVAERCFYIPLEVKMHEKESFDSLIVRALTNSSEGAASA